MAVYGIIPALFQREIHADNILMPAAIGTSQFQNLICLVGRVGHNGKRVAAWVHVAYGKVVCVRIIDGIFGCALRVEILIENEFAVFRVKKRNIDFVL